MIIMKQYLDLSIKEYQILVAHDWSVYQNLVIVSEDTRYKIAQVNENYRVGNITEEEQFNITLAFLDQEFKAQLN